MKVYELYLAEDGGDKVAKIVKASLGGPVGKVLLFLASIIYHGLLSKSVVAGKVTAKDAAIAARRNRIRRIEDALKREGGDDEVYKQVLINNQKYDKFAEGVKALRRIGKNDEADEFDRELVRLEEALTREEGTQRTREAVRAEGKVLGRLLQHLVAEIKKGKERPQDPKAQEEAERAEREREEEESIGIGSHM
jgi:hypothetical protein